MTNSELAGKVVIVTGGAVGIGRAICTELALAGATIAVLDVSSTKSTVDAVERAGGRARGIVANVTSEDEVERAVASVIADFGGIDVLVNNAGLFATLEPRPFEQLSVDEWHTVMNVNVVGVFVVTKAVVASMRSRGGGHVVNIASTAALKGVANLLHYVSSKGAVLAMTKALARELGPDNIVVNAVAPGFTVTDSVEDHAEEMRIMRLNAPSSRVLSREMMPQDVVGAVRFLAGPASNFITGQTAVVDGGAHFH